MPGKQLTNMTVNFGPQHPAATTCDGTQWRGETRGEEGVGLWVYLFTYSIQTWLLLQVYTRCLCTHVCVCVCVCVRVHVPPQYDVYLCVCASSLRQWNDVILI